MKEIFMFYLVVGYKKHEICEMCKSWREPDLEYRAHLLKQTNKPTKNPSIHC